MIKIAVIGANGRVGHKVVQEALSRGFFVKGIAKSNVEGVQESIVKDAMDLTYDDLQDCEFIVDALGFWKEDLLHFHTDTLKHLTDILADKPNKLLVVGGAGSLYVNNEHTIQVMDGDDFPEEYKPLAKAQGKQLEYLRTVNNVKWTYLSPAADFQADGEKTGNYILAGEELTLNSKGESVISYADYAIAMVDLIENGGHVCERISVLKK